MGNEQCRQEIKEWEKGERKRAEVSRSRTATSHLSCRRGRSSGAGGRWRQSHPVPLPSFGTLSCTPVTPTATLAPIPFPRSLPFSFVFDFSHLTCALTQNERISVTSSRARNYTEGHMMKCHKRAPRTWYNYTRAGFRKPKSRISGKRKVLRANV